MSPEGPHVKRMMMMGCFERLVRSKFKCGDQIY